MLTNLRNYVGMKNDQTLPGRLGGKAYAATGHGASLFGLPGDSDTLPALSGWPSRFDLPTSRKNAEGLLNLAQHIVSSLHIVRGMAVDRDAKGNITASETTQWSSFRDLTNRVAITAPTTISTSGKSTLKSTFRQTESELS